MFDRNNYLNQLISKKNNHLVKLITGIRRSGKSFLLNNIFYNWLLKNGYDNKHIIKFAFDSEEDIMLLDEYLPNEPTVITIKNTKVINEKKFVLFIRDVTKDGKDYCLLLDEIQLLNEFVKVLNSFIRHDNYDVYVTGSNSKFLSSEVDTEFGGRSSRIHLLPLVFSEYLTGTDLEKRDALDEYIRYGGIPLVQLGSSDDEKISQAVSIYKETYIKDIKDRHKNIDVKKLDETLAVIASMISKLVNPTKIENTFNSVYNIKLTNDTIGNYIKWFEESYLLNSVLRFDIKGRQYIGSPFKIYFEDVGIRNAILNFRDVDETQIIENIVYNELRYRGYNVDVGIVTIKENTNRLDKNGHLIYADTDTEVDFVANKSGKIYYIQVALAIPNEEKKEQEYKSIRNIPDSFKKIIVVKEEGKHYYTEEGFLRISLLDFLLNKDSLDI